MKTLIYGAGAVGLGLASCLLKAGHDLTIIARPQTVKALKRFGLKRSGIFGNAHFPPQQFCAASSLSSLVKNKFDLVLVTVKSFDSSSCAQDLKRHGTSFHPATIIVLCQNGWGNAEIFTKNLPRKYIYNARIITGFTRPQAHHVKITVHADAIRVGSLFSENLAAITPLCEAITRGGIPCQPSAAISKDLWAKMLYNCALNPLGAILDVPYGVLGEHSFSRSIMHEAIAEIFAVMRASGFRTYWPTAQKYLKVFYAHSLPLTYRHRSSTLQDLKAGRQTEIDALNGMVMTLGTRHHVPTPVNTTLYRLVKLMEAALFKASSKKVSSRKWL